MFGVAEASDDSRKVRRDFESPPGKAGFRTFSYSMAGWLPSGVS
jgi:hypothetical protein